MERIIKILVIDDEEEICALTRRFLEKRNFVVFTATNEEAALEITKREAPNIALLDVRLGSVSGMDLLPKLKDINKDLKVIMVTALDDEASIKEAKSLGADDYIAKPFTAEYLNDLIIQKIGSVGIKNR